MAATQPAEAGMRATDRHRQKRHGQHAAGLVAPSPAARDAVVVAMAHSWLATEAQPERTRSGQP
jgi:hypothetical protein